MTKKEIMQNEISTHGENLNKIFNTKFDNITLCKKLYRLEKKAHYATTCLCNTNTLHLMELNKHTGYNVAQTSEEEEEKFFNIITEAVYKILGEKSKDSFFINYDARGYALKLKTDFVNKERINGNNLHTDFGSYGILAPEF